jgi:hypothetical protein
VVKDRGSPHSAWCSLRSQDFVVGVKRSQRNVGVVNLHQTARALHMSFSELLVKVEAKKQRGDVEHHGSRSLDHRIAAKLQTRVNSDFVLYSPRAASTD